MYNWSVDEEALKENPDAYAVWALEQLINYGLNGRKIDERQLRRYWSRLTLDPARRRYLHFLLRDRLGSDATATQAP